MPSTCTPIELTCKDGVKLFGQRFVTESSSTSSPANIQHRILCWHGWLDNHRSFYRLAPILVDQLEGGVDLVALDFPGHGKSSHKSLDGPTMLLMDYVYYVHDAIQQLQWQHESITLIGHSMGSAVSFMYTAAFPVANLIMLDSLGPYPKPTSEVAKCLRKHINERIKGKNPCSVYPSLEVAIETRCGTAKAWGQYISKEAAKELVVGASKVLEEDGNKLQFLHDQRLKWPSILYTSPEQVEEMYREVASNSITKTCLLLADDGMPFDASKVARTKELLQPKVVTTLPGSHHFHMDPDTAKGVADVILTFLRHPPACCL